MKRLKEILKNLILGKKPSDEGQGDRIVKIALELVRKNGFQVARGGKTPAYYVGSTVIGIPRNINGGIEMGRALLHELVHGKQKQLSCRAGMYKRKPGEYDMNELTAEYGALCLLHGICETLGVENAMVPTMHEYIRGWSKDLDIRQAYKACQRGKRIALRILKDARKGKSRNLVVEPGVGYVDVEMIAGGDTPKWLWKIRHEGGEKLYLGTKYNVEVYKNAAVVVERTTGRIARVHTGEVKLFIINGPRVEDVLIPTDSLPEIQRKKHGMRIYKEYAKSSGPGGQNVNKRNTKVRVWVLVDEVASNHEEKKRLMKIADKNGKISASCQTERSQAANEKKAVENLKAKIKKALQEKKKRKKTKRPKYANEKRLRQKKLHSQKKQNRRRVEF